MVKKLLPKHGRNSKRMKVAVVSKIGVISDIHSNMESLTEALKILGNQGVEEIICLGDIVGYGPNHYSVLRWSEMYAL